MADSNCNRKVSNIQFLLESVEHIFLQKLATTGCSTPECTTLTHCTADRGRGGASPPNLDCRLERGKGVHRPTAGRGIGGAGPPNLDCCLERGGGGVHPPTAGRGLGAGPPTPRLERGRGGAGPPTPHLERGRGGVNPPTAGRGRGGVGPFTSGKGVSLPTHW